jgi:hypothetical protein
MADGYFGSTTSQACHNALVLKAAEDFMTTADSPCSRSHSSNEMVAFFTSCALQASQSKHSEDQPCFRPLIAVASLLFRLGGLHASQLPECTVGLHLR